MMPYNDPNKRRENHTRYMREVWYPNNRKRHIGFTNKVRDRFRIELREIAQRIKAEKGCVDCNTKDVRVLDFDHRDPNTKLFTISAAIGRTKSKSAVLKEISKCDVRCANCHRIRTWEENNKCKVNVKVVGITVR